MHICITGEKSLYFTANIGTYVLGFTARCIQSCKRYHIYNIL